MRSIGFAVGTAAIAVIGVLVWSSGVSTGSSSAQATGTIEGVITDAATGEPAVGVPILLAGPTPAGGFVTDASGRFKVDLLAPGDYLLAAGNLVEGVESEYAREWWDGAPDSASADPVAVLAGEVTTLAWDLEFGGIVEGVVTDEQTKEPIPGVSITWFILNSDGTREGGFGGPRTDGNGSYQLGGLHETDILVCFYSRPVGGGALIHLPECWDDQTEFGEGLSGVPGDPIAVAPMSIVTGIDAALAASNPISTTPSVPPDATVPSGTTVPGDTTSAPAAASSLPATGSSIPHDVQTSVALVAVIIGAVAIAATRRRHTSLR